MKYKIFWWIKTFIYYRLIFKHVGIFTYIGKIIFIYGGKRVYIGNRVRIFPGLRIETHYNGKIVIEDNVGIGQNFHITSAKQVLKIGANTTILGNVFITNFDHDYTEIDKHILEQSALIKETDIGANCFIGYGACIQAGTILGKHCIVGAQSVVRGTFPDYCVITGIPAKIIKRYDFEQKKWIKIKNNYE